MAAFQTQLRRLKRHPWVLGMGVVAAVVAFIVGFGKDIKTILGWISPESVVLHVTALEKEPYTERESIVVFEPTNSEMKVQKIAVYFPSSLGSRPIVARRAPFRIDFGVVQHDLNSYLQQFIPREAMPVGSSSWRCDGTVPVGIEIEFIFKGENQVNRTLYEWDFSFSTDENGAPFYLPTVNGLRFSRHLGRVANLTATLDSALQETEYKFESAH